MANTLGYMITFTTYGTWLQGDKRGYVKDGKIYLENKSLTETNKRLQAKSAVTLTEKQRFMAQSAIIAKSQIIGQKILALSICSTHIHIVAEYTPIPIKRIVAYYKASTRLAFKQTGLMGKVWTSGYNVRYCFDRATLEKKIKYVQNHKQKYLACRFTAGSQISLITSHGKTL